MKCVGVFSPHSVLRGSTTQYTSAIHICSTGPIGVICTKQVLVWPTVVCALLLLQSTYHSVYSLQFFLNFISNGAYLSRNACHDAGIVEICRNDASEFIFIQTQFRKRIDLMWERDNLLVNILSHVIFLFRLFSTFFSQLKINSDMSHFLLIIQ